jgi:hypothetical protein
LSELEICTTTKCLSGMRPELSVHHSVWLRRIQQENASKSRSEANEEAEKSEISLGASSMCGENGICPDSADEGMHNKYEWTSDQAVWRKFQVSSYQLSQDKNWMKATLICLHTTQWITNQLVFGKWTGSTRAGISLTSTSRCGNMVQCVANPCCSTLASSTEPTKVPNFPIKMWNFKSQRFLIMAED